MDKLFDLAFPKDDKVFNERIDECFGELIEDDGLMICNKCFRTFKYLIDSKFEYNERQIPNLYIPSTYMKVRLQEFIGIVDKDINHLLPLMYKEQNLIVKTTSDIYYILKIVVY